MRNIGGDPVGGGQFAGDLYFLMNGWQIVVSDTINVNGVLYHDDGIAPYLVMPGGGVTSTVSAIVQTTSADGTAEVNYDLVAQRVREEMDTHSIIASKIEDILQKVNTLDGDVDFSEILAELEIVEKKVDETQAFVLAS